MIAIHPLRQGEIGLNYRASEPITKLPPPVTRATNSQLLEQFVCIFAEKLRKYFIFLLYNRSAVNEEKIICIHEWRIDMDGLNSLPTLKEDSRLRPWFECMGHHYFPLESHLFLSRLSKVNFSKCFTKSIQCKAYSFTLSFYSHFPCCLLLYALPKKNAAIFKIMSYYHHRGTISVSRELINSICLIYPCLK